MAARKPGKVEAAAKTGDRRALLEAVRDQLAADMDREDTIAVRAQIAGQLQRVDDRLAALPPTREGSKLDEVKQRREARRAAAKAAPAAGRGGR